MRYVPPGHHKSVAAFREHLRSIDPALDCDPELRGADGPLGRPLELGDRVIGNRFCAQPMEGWDSTAEGMPSELTKRRWHRFGRSGAKLVWGGEAFAVAEDGRANPRQLYMNPSADVAAGLASLLCEIRTGHREIGEDPDEPVIGLQLTHSGRYSWPRDRAEPRIAYHHPLLDEMFAVPETPAILSDGELEAIGARFVELARLAWQAGFHFVDVKCCHGYLLHELLGAKARSGSYGGSFENRTRLLRRIVAGIRSACPGLEVAVRVSLADVCPYAADPDSGIGVPR
ncbi:MAG: NADH:flavin oxidoreductase, partial [Planctomycetota bacterium]